MSPVPLVIPKNGHLILLIDVELILDIFIGDKILCFLGEKQTAFLADDFPCRQNAIEVRFPTSALLY